MANYYVKLEGVRREQNASLITTDSDAFEATPTLYESKTYQTVTIPADTNWYQVLLGNVYTAKYFSLVSDYPVNVNLNNSGVIHDDTYNIELKGDVSYVYLQNAGTHEASVQISAYGDAGTRTVSPMNPLFTVTTITTDLTATLNHQIIFADCTAGAINITLPLVSQSENGKSYVVKKIDASVNAVTVTAAIGQLIDGGASKSWNVQNTSYSIVWNGAQWGVI